MTVDPEPFTRLSREVLVANQWHRYCRDRYVLADRTEGEYFYVDMPGSVTVIPRFADGSTALCRVHRYLLGADFWEFPTGGVQPDQDPLDIAKLELREEAGLTAAQWRPVGRFAPYKGVANEVCRVFAAEDLQQVEQDLEPSEAITVHRMGWAEAKQTLIHQPVADGHSLAALQLYDAGAGQA